VGCVGRSMVNGANAQRRTGVQTPPSNIYPTSRTRLGTSVLSKSGSGLLWKRPGNPAASPVVALADAPPPCFEWSIAQSPCTGTGGKTDVGVTLEKSSERPPEAVARRPKPAIHFPSDTHFKGRKPTQIIGPRCMRLSFRLRERLRSVFAPWPTSSVTDKAGVALRP